MTENFDWGNLYDTNQRGTIYHTKIHPLLESIFWINTRIPEGINFKTNIISERGIQDLILVWTCRRKIGNIMYSIGEYLKSTDKMNSIKSKLHTKDGLYYIWTIPDKNYLLQTIVTSPDGQIVGMLKDDTGSEGHYLHYRQIIVLLDITTKYGNKYLVDRVNEVKRALEIKHTQWHYIRNKGDLQICLTKDKYRNTTAEGVQCGTTPPQYQLWARLSTGEIINKSDLECLTRTRLDQGQVDVRPCQRMLEEQYRQKWDLEGDANNYRLVNKWGSSQFLTKNLSNTKLKGFDFYSQNDNQIWQFDPPIRND